MQPDPKTRVCFECEKPIVNPFYVLHTSADVNGLELAVCIPFNHKVEREVVAREPAPDYFQVSLATGNPAAKSGEVFDPAYTRLPVCFYVPKSEIASHMPKCYKALSARQQ